MNTTDEGLVMPVLTNPIIKNVTGFSFTTTYFYIHYANLYDGTFPKKKDITQEWFDTLKKKFLEPFELDEKGGFQGALKDAKEFSPEIFVEMVHRFVIGIPFGKPFDAMTYFSSYCDLFPNDKMGFINFIENYIKKATVIKPLLPKKFDQTIFNHCISYMKAEIKNTSKKKVGRTPAKPKSLEAICPKFEEVMVCLVEDTLIKKGEDGNYSFTRARELNFPTLVGCIGYYLYIKGLLPPKDGYKPGEIARAFYLTFNLDKILNSNGECIKFENFEKPFRCPPSGGSGAEFNYDNYKDKFSKLVKKFNDRHPTEKLYK